MSHYLKYNASNLVFYISQTRQSNKKIINDFYKKEKENQMNEFVHKKVPNQIEKKKSKSKLEKFGIILLRKRKFPLPFHS